MVFTSGPPDATYGYSVPDLYLMKSRGHLRHGVEREDEAPR